MSELGETEKERELACFLRKPYSERRKYLSEHPESHFPDDEDEDADEEPTE